MSVCFISMATVIIVSVSYNLKRECFVRWWQDGNHTVTMEKNML